MSLPLPRYLPPRDHRWDAKPDASLDWDTKLNQILSSSPTTTSTTRAKRVGGRSGEGDPFRLRGIPCIARGVQGHIPGTRP